MKRIKSVFEDNHWLCNLIFPVLSTLFLLFASPYTSLLNPYYGYDSAVFMVVGKGWSKGLMPYRDLFDHKGPLLYLINAIGFCISNDKLGVLLVQITFMSTSLFVLYKISRLFVDKKWACIVVCMFMFLYCAMISEGNMTEEWSLPFTFIPLYLILVHTQQGKGIEEHPVKYTFIYGVCFGMHCLIRINNGAVILGILIACTILLIHQNNYSFLFKNICVFLAGMVIPIIPFLVYFYCNNAIYDFVYANYIYNILYASIGSAGKTIKDWVLILFRLISLPVMLYCGFGLMKAKQLKTECYFIFTTMAITAAMTMLMGYGWLHYYLVYVPVMLVGLLICIRFAMIHVEEKSRRGRIVLLLFIFAVPFTWNAIRHVGKNVLFDFRGYYDSEIASVNELMEYIPENERNSIWSYDVAPKFYLYSDTLPAYKYFTLQSFQSVGNKYIQPGIEKMLKNNPPEWIVMNTAPCGNEIVNEALINEYEYVASVEYGLSLKLYRFHDQAIGDKR